MMRLPPHRIMLPSSHDKGTPRVELDRYRPPSRPGVATRIALKVVRPKEVATLG